MPAAIRSRPRLRLRLFDEHELFFVVGATHQTAPLAVREKLSLPTEAAAALQTELAAIGGLRELALLNTCNRIEFYGVADDASAVSALESLYCTRQQFAPDEFEKIRMLRSDRDALQHLFEVAAGLDSQMLGETEIFGQVKEAYATAQTRQSAGPVLNRIFQKTFQAAKLARTQTAITEGQVSVANVAVELALIFSAASAKCGFFCSAQATSEKKLPRRFRVAAAGTLTVASRRLERAMELAGLLGASALPFEQHENRLAESDVVVGSTAAPETVVSLASVTAAMKKRPSRPLFFIDLALPRDIDPQVAGLENVFLYNLDDLAKIAEQNRVAREAEISKARDLLSERAAKLWEQVQPHVKTAPHEGNRSAAAEFTTAQRRENSPTPRVNPQA